MRAWNFLIVSLLIEKSHQFATPSSRSPRICDLPKSDENGSSLRQPKRSKWICNRTNRMPPGMGNKGLDSVESMGALSPVEAWCVHHLEASYSKALMIRCPFWKRRASDILDSIDQIMRFLVIRHKSLPLVGPPFGWRCKDANVPKSTNLTVREFAAIIYSDWKVENNKGYYITGRLTPSIYRDDCFFDGPDPDMPIKGLRKYINAASQLFDPVKSKAELLSLDVVESGLDNSKSFEDTCIFATWRISGVLMLPWRPTLPEWTGTTTYYRDEDGLIYKHVETWDLPVWEAFVRTFWPKFAEFVWLEN